ncbi:MAG: hypothetical protein ACE5PO_02380 [Candidatus Bathyarchaeia archaeon]
MADEFSIVGKPLPSVDGEAIVTGSAVYAADIYLPRMLHAKVLKSSPPRFHQENRRNPS